MRVVPSVLVNFMDKNLHAIAPASLTANGFRGVPYDHGYAPLVRAFVDLLDDLPEELLYALSETEVAQLQIARNEVLAALVAWERGNPTPKIAAARFIAGNPHLLVLIRDLLDKCPDQVPSPTTTKLAFIADVSFREHLRADIDSVARALHSGDWKTATIMAGSVIEALLLWSVDAAEARTPGSYGKRKAVLDATRLAAKKRPSRATRTSWFWTNW